MAVNLSADAQTGKTRQRPQEAGLASAIGTCELPQIPWFYFEVYANQQLAIAPLDAHLSGGEQ